MPSIAATEAPLDEQLQAIEVDLPGFPVRAEAELDAFVEQARATNAQTRRFRERSWARPGSQRETWTPHSNSPISWNAMGEPL